MGPPGKTRNRPIYTNRECHRAKMLKNKGFSILETTAGGPFCAAPRRSCKWVPPPPRRGDPFTPAHDGAVNGSPAGPPICNGTRASCKSPPGPGYPFTTGRETDTNAAKAKATGQRSRWMGERENAKGPKTARRLADWIFYVPKSNFEFAETSGL